MFKFFEIILCAFFGSITNMDKFTFILCVIVSISYVNSQDTKAKFEATDDDTYNVLQRDGSYEFGYANRDRGASYHFADANARNVVRGKFGSRNPGTGRIDETIYTAGPRGYRPRGPNVHRKYDLNQNGPRPIGNRDDPFFDPSEDPSYSFGFRTRTYNRDENANRNGDVTGRYSYLDDIGERHNVEYVAGKNTGFHVKTAYPDSNPRSYGALYYSGPGKKPRGHTSIQKNLDGSYRFVSAGPDQRRTETSDSIGNVRGSYTYIDDKGKQHSVHYIAGPNIGYRVLKNPKNYPTLFPFSQRPIPTLDPFDAGLLPTSIPDDFIFDEENLNTAASGHVKPRPNYGSGNKRPTPPGGGFLGAANKPGQSKPFDEDGDLDDDDLFGAPPSKGGSSGGSASGGSGGNTGSSGSGGSSNIGGGGSGSVGSSENSGSSGSPSEGPSGGDGLFDGDNNDFDDSDNVFGDKRPGSTAGYPTGNKPPGGGYPSVKPSPAFPSDDDNFDDGFPSGPSGGSRPGGVSPTRPTGGFPTRPGGGSGANRPPGGSSSEVDRYPSGGGNKGPNYGLGDDNDDGTDTGLNLFPADDDSNWSGKERGTILRNLGAKNVNLPPGVAVRAHVQSIDILPYGSRLPSPSDQLDNDSTKKTS
ncbi:translation initiation factor IF-2-like [Chrysoperla carnea]|uniref:translation initiation factor IF-2-like n=1 Tax=Chrysoperla carnea TaxID=189513 RepID=UPI001D07B732|nr:translation initiation factor IF-2-like [Chrysoperla carnea]